MTIIQQRLNLIPELAKETSRQAGAPLTVAGLFAGVGGIEVGLRQAGHATRLLCEIDEAATAVLKSRIPDAFHHADIRDLEFPADVDLLAAGFPCQDLSISGQRDGISGSRSGLVGHVFRLIDRATPPPRWILLENVPFILQLHNGKGMQYLISELERRHFRWAYRIIDTRSFGLPQRRGRLLLLASKTEDPRSVLLGPDTNGPTVAAGTEDPFCGFYWTEGHRGIGWSEDLLPPIKVGSGLGIPSPPAIWNPRDGIIFTPDIRDIERLQGFPEGWTEPADALGLRKLRWKLIGNSVSVPLARWLGEQLRSPSRYDDRYDCTIPGLAKWPDAAWGGNGKRFCSAASMWPVSTQLPSLSEFLHHPGRPLSPRAAAGLLNRLSRSGSRVPNRFRNDLRLLAERQMECAED